MGSLEMTKDLMGDHLSLNKSPWKTKEMRDTQRRSPVKMKAGDEEMHRVYKPNPTTKAIRNH